MKILKSLITILIFSSLCGSSLAQGGKVVKEKKVNKSVVIELEDYREKFYKSYFKKLKGENLLLVSEIPDYQSVSFEETMVDLNDFDYIKINNKKETFKKSMISGLILGTATFFIVKSAAKSETFDRQTAFLKIGSSGTTEGLIAGSAAFGIGLIVYDSIFNRRLKIEDNKKEILKKLKRIKI